MIFIANVRDSYTVRASLADSMFDLVVNPSSPNSTFQFKHEFTVKTMLMAIVDVIVLMWLLVQTPLGQGGVLGSIWWSLGFIWLSYLLIRPTNTKLQGYSYIKPMMNYVNHNYRNVSTRMAAPSAPVADIVGLKGITAEGKIAFTNDDVGEIVELTGNASILMFDDDKQSVINSVGNFYRHVRPQVGLTFDNVSAPQRVDTQLKAKNAQADMLINNTSGLQAIINTQKKVLSEYVGKSFKALHQYAIVRTTSYDELDAFNEWLAMQSDARGQDNFLRGYRILNKPDEVRTYVRGIFS